MALVEGQLAVDTFEKIFRYVSPQEVHDPFYPGGMFESLEGGEVLEGKDARFIFDLVNLGFQLITKFLSLEASLLHECCEAFELSP